MRNEKIKDIIKRIVAVGLLGIAVAFTCSCGSTEKYVDHITEEYSTSEVAAKYLEKYDDTFEYIGEVTAPFQNTQRWHQFKSLKYPNDTVTVEITAVGNSKEEHICSDNYLNCKYREQIEKDCQQFLHDIFGAESIVKAEPSPYYTNGDYSDGTEYTKFISDGYNGVEIEAVVHSDISLAEIQDKAKLIEETGKRLGMKIGGNIYFAVNDDQWMAYDDIKSQYKVKMNRIMFQIDTDGSVNRYGWN